jgi:hypothetical protein
MPALFLIFEMNEIASDGVASSLAVASCIH